MTRVGCHCDRGLESPELRGYAYDKTRHCPACWAFWHRTDMNAALGGTGAVPIRLVPTIQEAIQKEFLRPCNYRGKDTGLTETCKTCTGERKVPLFVCEKLGGTCFEGNYTVPTSKACNSCPHKDTSKEGDVPCGLVVGSYLWPSLTEMHIKLARRVLGRHVPILIVDDKSDATEKREAICKKYGVDFFTTGERIGHVGGDAAAFRYGLEWAKENGVRVLAKLSQRLFLTRPRWLQEGAKELLASTLSTASQPQVQVPNVMPAYDLRSDCVLLDVDQWDANTIEVKKYNPTEGVERIITGEELIHSRIPGGVFHPWSEITSNRCDPRPAEINHWNNTRKGFEKLASELGVKLDAKFHADGWGREHERGEYSFG